MKIEDSESSEDHGEPSSDESAYDDIVYQDFSDKDQPNDTDSSESELPPPSTPKKVEVFSSEDSDSNETIESLSEDSSTKQCQIIEFKCKNEQTIKTGLGDSFKNNSKNTTGLIRLQCEGCEKTFKLRIQLNKHSKKCNSQ